jgi:hypothetical protein
MSSVYPLSTTSYEGQKAQSIKMDQYGHSQTVGKASIESSPFVKGIRKRLKDTHNVFEKNTVGS